MSNLEGSNLEDRADDYEKRLAEAGGTDTVVGGLVVTAQRTKRLMRWLVVSIIFDIGLSFSLAYVAFNARYEANDADRAAKVACVQSAKNSIVVNEVLNELVENTSQLPLTQKQKDDRIAGYKELIIDIPNCFNGK